MRAFLFYHFFDFIDTKIKYTFHQSERWVVLRDMLQNVFSLITQPTPTTTSQARIFVPLFSSYFLNVIPMLKALDPCSLSVVHVAIWWLRNEIIIMHASIDRYEADHENVHFCLSLTMLKILFNLCACKNMCFYFKSIFIAFTIYFLIIISSVSTTLL